MMTIGDLSGLGALTIALFWVGMSIRANDQLTKRWRTTARELEQRVTKLERRYTRERNRRVQLERAMRAAGLILPPWPAHDVDPDDPAQDEDLDPEPQTATVIQLPWRNR